MKWLYSYRQSAVCVGPRWCRRCSVDWKRNPTEVVVRRMTSRLTSRLRHARVCQSWRRCKPPATYPSNHSPVKPRRPHARKFWPPRWSETSRRRPSYASPTHGHAHTVRIRCL